MPRKKRNDLAVKIDADIVRKARTICSYSDITLAEYLSGFLKPIIDREFEGFKKKLTEPDRANRTR